MREITSHQTNACNEAITIHADEADPQNGNAPHLYRVTIHGEEPQDAEGVELRFQHGLVKEVGTNGITNEVLLAIVADRLHGFQSGPYACEENADALLHVLAAMSRLHERTKARVARGVEGTHEV